MQSLLRYRCDMAGCCKVVLHPKWGASMYPATLFAIAPLPVLLDALGVPLHARPAAALTHASVDAPRAVDASVEADAGACVVHPCSVSPLAS
ncbi:hypothetical protein EON67_09515 [archaeon]|nr:MAG: hypothetical protein EON67_09515 [archaeon]